MHDFDDKDIDISKFIEDHKKQTYEELKDDPRFIKWTQETDLQKRKEILNELTGDNNLARVTLARLVSK